MIRKLRCVPRKCAGPGTLVFWHYAEEVREETLVVAALGQSIFLLLPANLFCSMPDCTADVGLLAPGNVSFRRDKSLSEVLVHGKPSASLTTVTGTAPSSEFLKGFQRFSATQKLQIPKPQTLKRQVSQIKRIRHMRARPAGRRFLDMLVARNILRGRNSLTLPLLATLWIAKVS